MDLLRVTKICLGGGMARACLLAVLSLAVTGLHAQTSGDALEYQKKAELINSFTRFIEWPARKFAYPDSPFVIGVFGSDNISGFLQESIGDRQIKGRPVVVKHFLNTRELRACHVLFISRSERDRLPGILAEVQRENVLTIGESDNFLARRGVINFFNTGGQVQFRISLEAASREKLVVRSELLQFAAPAVGLSMAPPVGARPGDFSR